MRLLRHFEDVPPELKGAVVAIGNFDGVHRGHQVVLGAAVDEAKRRGAKLAVLTFEPHPRSFFKPEEPAFRLTPFRIKMRHLQDLGVDVAFVLPFDHAMSQRSAAAFVEDVLVKGIGAAHVVVGSDFCYGNKRSGNAGVLTEAGRAHGFGVTAVSPQTGADGQVYSSTLIRRSCRPEMRLAAALALNRPWEIEGRVEHGDQRGRLLGFPTANVALGEFMHPKLGVYAVKAALDTPGDTATGLQWIGGVANLGSRPTVGGTRVQLEAHLFDYAGDLYGRHLRVALLGFIRPEMKFSGLDQLKAQIAADSETARNLLASYHGPALREHPAAIPEDWPESLRQPVD